MGSLNAVVVSEGPDVKEVLHTKVGFSMSLPLTLLNFRIQNLHS